MTTARASVQIPSSVLPAEEVLAGAVVVAGTGAMEGEAVGLLVVVRTGAEVVWAAGATVAGVLAVGFIVTADVLVTGESVTAIATGAVVVAIGAVVEDSTGASVGEVVGVAVGAIVVTEAAVGAAVDETGSTGHEAGLVPNVRSTMSAVAMLACSS